MASAAFTRWAQAGGVSRSGQSKSLPKSLEPMVFVALQFCRLGRSYFCKTNGVPRIGCSNPFAAR